MSEIWPLLKQAKVAISYFIVDTETSCLASLQPVENLRGPHVARQQQLSVDMRRVRPQQHTRRLPQLLSIDGTDRLDRCARGRNFSPIPPIPASFASIPTRLRALCDPNPTRPRTSFFPSQPVPITLCSVIAPYRSLTTCTAADQRRNVVFVSARP